jgi:DNA-binding MarR family transcriptional regulator
MNDDDDGFNWDSKLPKLTLVERLRVSRAEQVVLMALRLNPGAVQGQVYWSTLDTRERIWALGDTDVTQAVKALLAKGLIRRRGGGWSNRNRPDWFEIDEESAGDFIYEL